MDKSFMEAVKELGKDISINYSPGGESTNPSYNISSTKTNLFDVASKLNLLSSLHGLVKNFMNSNSAEYVQSGNIFKR